MEIEPIYKFVLDNLRMISPDGKKEIVFKDCTMFSIEQTYQPYGSPGVGTFRFGSIEYRDIDKETDFVTANAEEIEALFFER